MGLGLLDSAQYSATNSNRSWRGTTLVALRNAAWTALRGAFFMCVFYYPFKHLRFKHSSDAGFTIISTIDVLLEYVVLLKWNCSQLYDFKSNSEMSVVEMVVKPSYELTDINGFSAAWSAFHLNRVIIIFGSSAILKCRLLKWSLDHPMNSEHSLSTSPFSNRGTAKLLAFGVFIRTHIHKQYMHVYTYVYIYIYIYTHLWACMYVCMYIYICTYIHSCSY